MFIAALIIIAKTWNCGQEEKKEVYIYTMEYYTAIKKHVFCSNMDAAEGH